MNDTIVANASANGIGSISIVRLSGSKSLEIAKKVTAHNELKPRYAHLSPLYDAQGELIDEAVVIYFKSPHSFTGEDIVEFQCHGGYIISSEIIDLCVHYGARLAEPGEYSKRAFLNGKIDLSQAEAIAKIIEAKNLDAAKILAKQLKGSLLDFVEQSREQLLLILANSEVMIDYAEEDLPVDIQETIAQKLDTLEDKLRAILESSHRRKGLIEGFRVAIVGKPNVGKSSLLNRFLDYERAIVSDIEGTTRDTIEESVRIGSHLIRLIDTAGIRESNDAIEQIGVQRSLASIEEADIIIALFDGSREFDQLDEDIMAKLTDLDPSKHLIKVINKSDLNQKIAHPFLEDGALKISIKENFTNLTEALQSLLDSIAKDDEIMLVTSRQILALSDALSHIGESRLFLAKSELEFFSYHLNEALKKISLISKPYDNEDILDKMFGEFCLGK
jgi:tRNA modification GTPase